MMKQDEFTGPITMVDAAEDLRASKVAAGRKELYLRLLEEHFIVSSRLCIEEGSISRDEDVRLARLRRVIDRLRSTRR